MLGRVVWQAGWPSPTTPSGGQTFPPGTTPTGQTPDGRKVQVTLGLVADAAGWPTARAADGEKNVRTAEGSLSEIERKGTPQDLSMAAAVSGWPTPMAGTPAQNGNNEAGNTDSSRKTQALVTELTGPARLTVSGELLTGCFAETLSGGQLSPAHSLWLMLGPIGTVWASCGERVTRSTSRKRKPTSKS